MKKTISILPLIMALLLFVSCANTVKPQESAAPVAQNTEAGRQTEPPAGENKTLVVFFSASGNTKALSEKLAAYLGADIKEIVPSKPYTEADLNYRDGGSRSATEQNDLESRPKIASDIVIDGYSTLFIAYPIWFGKAPRIMNTFVESKNFYGKTVIPFCTSGSSDIGTSADELAQLAGSGKWVDGKRFASNAGAAEIEAWAKSTLDRMLDIPLKLVINGSEVEVMWSNNDSVKALAEHAKEKPLTIKMQSYGGFEQVGQIGKTLISKDADISAVPGDIMLYSGDRIALFFGTNFWAYTKLGHICSKTDEQLRTLLCGDEVEITIFYGE